MSAYDYAREYIESVGARYAGGENERKAQEWIEGKLKSLGLKVFIDSFKFISSENYYRILTLIVMTIQLLLLWYARYLNPLIILASFIAIMFFFAKIYKKIDVRLANTPSKNILASFKAEIGENKEEKKVLICAHYDSPRNLSKILQRLEEAFRTLNPFLSLVFISFLFVEALRSFLYLLSLKNYLLYSQFLLERLWNYLWMVFIFIFLPFITFGYVMLIYNWVRKKENSVGADDNASGVGCLLELAERLKKRPLKNLEPYFALWGAEERGLFGSRQFVRKYDEKLSKEKLYVLNMDVVGVGSTIVITSGQGVVFRKRCDEKLLEMLEKACLEVGANFELSWESPITGGSSDHQEWVDRGYKAMSIFREDKRGLSIFAKLFAKLLLIPHPTQFSLKHVHTERDDLKILKKETLLETVEVAESYLRKLDNLEG